MSSPPESESFMSRPIQHRRSVLKGALASAAGLTLGACQPLSDQGWVKSFIGLGEAINYKVQRALLGMDTLAAEFTEADLSPIFKPNGTFDPQDEDYKAFAAKNFTDFKLVVGGLVDRPVELTLQELRAMPSRTQITRHDCVEGWSAIGKWKGVPLAAILDRVGVKPDARFVVFFCFDTMEEGAKGPVRYYESIDLIDARHPQTILAYEMNDQTLPIANGAPLRVRVERQLGYKMAKFIRRIELVGDYSGIAGGKGGYWPDRGYDWFAGI
jgi:DMSO/TMAO reductase YedYZ molybdopterin-dependent catalytic subunit